MIRNILSVDLGQSKDPAAMLRADISEGGKLHITMLATLRWREPAELQRWIGRTSPETLAIVDGTGPHRGLALSMSSWSQLWGPLVLLQIRAGDATSQDPRMTCVPKSDLVGSLEDGIVRRLFSLPRALEMADELVDQLEHYQRIPGARGPRYAAKPGYHDDLAVCLAYALWIRPRIPKVGSAIPDARKVASPL